MNKIILILILTISLSIPNAQNIPSSKDNSMLVISTAGLHIREQPTSRSKSLALVKFGKRVKLMDDSSSGSDTLKLNNGEHIVGEWRKVTYKNMVGFMFRPYLLSINREQFPVKRINNNYALWYGTGTCFNNIQYDEGLNWLAFGVDKNGRETVKKIVPSFYWEKGPIEDYIMLETKLNFQPHFVVGNKEKWPPTQAGIFNKIDYEKKFDESRVINKQIYFDEKRDALIYCYENRDIDFSYDNLRAYAVRWRGDLNHDKVDDFIIQYGDKSGKVVLIQSNLSKKQNPFERIAEFKIGYCC